ncbi:hypothetical protein EYB33_15175 [Lysinibacillus sphaericus]|uniref:site-specific integrase n=1 Tax=Lysinibacillus sphaericus TaxID=1421 RepID=UPI001E459EF0|nr:site-specific integrase [Lysinibacillus sphaericus]UDK97566.1 hypothetical protein EYB33_15175 [Lysinibacillus sphaericus]
MNSNNVKVIEAIEAQFNFYNYIKSKRGLLSINNHFRFFEILGINHTEKYVKKRREVLLKISNFSEDELYNEFIIKSDSNVNPVVLDYIFLNMLFGKIKYNRDFVEGMIYKGKEKYLKGVAYFLDIDNLSYLPKYNELKIKSNKKFLLRFYLRMNYEEKLMTEKDIYRLFISSYEKYNNDIWRNKCIEFKNVIYPKLYNDKVVECRQDVVNYIEKIKYNKIVNVQEHLSNKIDQYLGQYKNTEFYMLICQYTNYKIGNSATTISKSDMNYLLFLIKLFSKFTIHCLENEIDPITNMYEINGFHIERYTENSSNYDRNCLITLLKYYNSICPVNKRLGYEILGMKARSSKSRRMNKTALKESAMGALVSSLFEAILETRNNLLILKSDLEILYYLNLRCLWLILLSGARISEIRRLKLVLTIETISHDEPYIHLHTLKGGNDRELLLRGKELENSSKYEDDWLNLDIIKEAVEAATLLYEKSDINIDGNLYLFPSYKNFYKEVSYSSIAKLLKDIQIKNRIVHGSIYDILDREAYKNNPKIINELDKPLFTSHAFRHFTVEVLRKYAMLTRIEIMKYTGHKNPKSENVYGEHFLIVANVLKLMEKNGHLYGENKLINANDLLNTEYKEDMDELLFKEDITTHLAQVDGTFGKNDISIYLDKETSCETPHPCAETGIGCTSCDFFKAGEETVMKKAAVMELIRYEFEQITIEVRELNNLEKELLKDKKNSDLLLINKFQDVCYRFERINLTKERTLISNISGFGWSISNANKIITNLMRESMKVDIKSSLIQKLKKIIKNGQYEWDISAKIYRDIRNRQVFKIGE